MLKRVSDLPASAACRSPEHNPPSMIVLSPGLYEHTCPACGQATRFAVGGAVMGWQGAGQLSPGDLLCAAPKTC